MLSTIFTFWFIGLAVLTVWKKNPRRPSWVDNIYDVIYLPVIRFLKSLYQKFSQGGASINSGQPNTTSSIPDNSSFVSEAVELQFQLKDGQWITDTSIAGPPNTKAISQGLSDLMRQKAGTANYAGRVRAVGPVSGQIYEIR